MDNEDKITHIFVIFRTILEKIKQIYYIHSGKRDLTYETLQLALDFNI